jgi:hypothetical protein
MNWLATAAIFAACSALLAQATPAPLPPAPSSQGDDAQKGRATQDPNARTEQRAQSMREQIGQGRTVQSHVRVMVRLKNGNRLQGVVKDGSLVERVDGLRFVEAQAKDRGAGIRLWYTAGARSYVFLPFADFAEYEVMQRLSDKQILDIEGEMQMDERRAAERAAKAAQKAAASAPPAGETSPAPTAEPAKVPAAKAAKGDAAKTGNEKTAKEPAAAAAQPGAGNEQEKKWFQLMQTYPPDDGWNKARRDEISRRLAVIGAKPNERELAFVEQFAEWEKAAAHFGVDLEQPASDPNGVGAEGNGAGSKPAETGKKKRRR